jgi:hypothetical protein
MTHLLCSAMILGTLLAGPLGAREESHASIEVQLRFEDGAPVPFARVFARPPLGLMFEAGAHVEEVYEGQALGGGRFLIDALPPGGGWRFYACGGAFVPQGSSVFALHRSERRSFELRVARGASVSGGVTDAEGRAIEGALVRARRRLPWFFHYEHRDHPLHWLLQPELEVTTDADGTFAIAGLELGGWELEVSDPRYVREQRLLAFARNEVKSRFPLVLQRGERVRGRVRAADGAPIAGAELEWRSSSDRELERRIAGITARSDRDGRFEFACLRRLEAGVTAPAWLEARAVGFARAELRVDLPTLESLEITLEPIEREAGAEVPAADASEPEPEREPLAPASLGSIVGTVTKRDGRPLEDALVIVSSSDRRSSSRTDANGRYRIDHLMPGEDYVVTVVPPTTPGLDAAQDACEREDRQRVVAGEATIFDVVAPEVALRDLRLVLRRATGEPPAAGVVYLLPRHPNENFEIGAEGRVALLDSHGRIEVRDLLPGLYFLAVWDTGRRPVVSYAVDLPFAESDPASRELMLPSTVVRGVVRDAQGRPLAGARVRMRAIPKRTRPTLGRSSLLGELQDAWEPGRMTDREGRFRLEGWAPGRYALEVHGDPELAGDGIGSTASASLELRDERSCVELALEARPPHLRSLYLLDAETQEPYPEAFGVAEHLSSGWRVSLHLHPSENGMLWFQEHAGSELQVHLFARDRVPQSVRLRFDGAGERSRTVALEPGARVRFHARSARGTAMASCRLEVERGPTLDGVLGWLEDHSGSELGFWPSLTDAEGVLVRRDLPAGRCLVRLTRGSQASAWTEIEVPAEGEQDVLLELR